MPAPGQLSLFDRPMTSADRTRLGDQEYRQIVELRKQRRRVYRQGGTIVVDGKATRFDLTTLKAKGPAK